MERSGRLMIVLGTVLVSSLASLTCRGQTAQVAPTTAREDSPHAGGPDLNAKTTRLDSVDLRHPINFGDFFRSPGESGPREPATPGTTRAASIRARVTSQPEPLPTPSPSRATVPPPRQFGPPSRTITPMPAEASNLRTPVGEYSVNIKPAPLDSNELGFPINLATALRLSDARPLIVAAAQASVWVAEAQLTRAKVLWVPQLNIGGDYIRHDGGGPDFNKGILTAPSVNFFYGGGGLWEIVILDRCLL